MVQKLQSAIVQELKAFRTGPHSKGERFTGSLPRIPNPGAADYGVHKTSLYRSFETIENKSSILCLLPVHKTTVF
jgi:hypothetical protein